MTSSNIILLSIARCGSIPIQSAFERLYGSEQYEEYILPTEKPDIMIEKDEQSIDIVDIAENIIEEEVEVTKDHLPMLILIGSVILLLILLGFNIYWLAKILHKRETSETPEEYIDADKTKEIKNTIEVSNTHENAKLQIPQLLSSSKDPVKDIDEWSESNCSLNSQDSRFKKHAAGNSEDSIEDSEDTEKDNISESSVQITLEIETFEAKDITPKETMVDRKVECLHCDKKFLDQNGMRTHILSKHKNDSNHFSDELLLPSECSNSDSQLSSRRGSESDTSLESIITNTQESFIHQESNSAIKYIQQLPSNVTTHISNSSFSKTKNELNRNNSRRKSKKKKKTNL